MAGAVTPFPGQQVGPLSTLMPISRCGPVDMPTMPHPTSAMGCPAATTVPTGTSAGNAVAVIDEASVKRAAGDLEHGRHGTETGDPLLDDHAVGDRQLDRRPATGSSSRGDVDALIGRPRARRLDHRPGRDWEHEPLARTERVELLDHLKFPPDLDERYRVGVAVSHRRRGGAGGRRVADAWLHRLGV